MLWIYSEYVMNIRWKEQICNSWATCVHKVVGEPQAKQTVALQGNVSRKPKPRRLVEYMLQPLTHNIKRASARSSHMCLLPYPLLSSLVCELFLNMYCSKVAELFPSTVCLCCVAYTITIVIVLSLKTIMRYTTLIIYYYYDYYCFVLLWLSLWLVWWIHVFMCVLSLCQFY